MEQLGINFRIMVSEVDEQITPGQSPETLVQELARRKAEAVALGEDEGLVIAADTLVISDGHIFGKPTSPDEAVAMLQQLSGKSHTVVTGVAVVNAATGEVLTGAEKTEVYFRPLTEEEIWAYVRSGEPLDKAGAYGIQGLGSLLVSRIEGCFFNVVGLPLAKLAEMLRHFGVDLLNRPN
ncbi:MAG: septum formation inhibitor Maf [Firmicutes bacterium]|nr:septum formation inhibitor Maf [Bacillota bacterium]